MDLNISHNVNLGNLDKFESSLNMLLSRLEGLFKSGMPNGNPNIITPQNKNDTSSGAQSTSSGRQSDAINKTTSKFESLSQQIANVSNALADLARSQKRMAMVNSVNMAALSPAERANIRKEELAHNEVLSEQRRKFRQENLKDKSSQKWKNIGAGVLTASVIAAAYQANGWGQTVGGEAKSVNVGANNYNSFLSDYYNRRLGTENSAASTGIMGLAGAGTAIGASVGGPWGALIGGASGLTAGVANYFLGKNTAQEQALNQLALSQDLTSYKLRTRGISDLGDMSIYSTSGVLGTKTPTPLTKLQESLAKKNPAYLPYLQDVSLSSRPDIFKSLSLDQQAGFTKDVGRAALTTGSDVGSLSKVVTNLSSMTNKDPSTLLNKLVQDNIKYGGDMVSNTAKIVQLMQGTGMSYDKASNLVNKYQYNDAALSNQVNTSMVSPNNRWVANIYRQMIKSESGMDPEDPKFLQKYRNASKKGSVDPVYMLADQFYALNRFNQWVNSSGGANATKIGTDQDTPQMKAFMDMVAKQIADIVVNTQNVQAQVVNIYGTGNNMSGQPPSGSRSDYPASNQNMAHPDQTARQSRSDYPAYRTSENTSLKNILNHGAPGKPNGTLYGNLSDMEALGRRLGKTLQLDNRSGTGTIGVKH